MTRRCPWRVHASVALLATVIGRTAGNKGHTLRHAHRTVSQILQGFWTNSTYTPLQRPKGVTKEFYTPEEMAEIEKRAAERGICGDGGRNGGGRALRRGAIRAQPEPVDVRTESANLAHRRSPDGRIPPMTEEADEASCRAGGSAGNG